MSALALGAAFGCGAVAPRRSFAIRRARYARVRVAAVASGSEQPGSASGGHPSARARANLLATLADAESADAKAKKAKKAKKAAGADERSKKKSGAKKSGTSGRKKESGASSSQSSSSAGSRRASARTKKSAPKKTKPEWEVLHYEQPYIKTPPPTRRPWTAYPWDRPGVAGGPPKELDELRWSPNGNALMQIDRQTIPYNQFVKDLLAKDQIREIHWRRDGHDRYLIIYQDDRVGYVQVPQDDWVTTDLINKQPGLRIHEITEEGERDASTGEYMSAGDTSARLFTQYGVPLIGVGVVWFIVWSMNRFKGDFDDRQKMLELERREEALAKVENDQKLVALKTQLSLMDPTKSENDKALYEKIETELEVLRAKLQARARFAVSEEGGGPGGGQGAGGASSEEAVSGFMKVDGMKVIGKRDVAGADGEPADAVAEAMAAARAAKAEDEKAANERTVGGKRTFSNDATDERGLSTTMAGATAAQTAAIDERAEKDALRKKEERKQGKLRSKMKMRDESEIVKFADVAGIGDAKIELAEIVDFFRKPEKFKSSGAVVPKGVMLTGPPGCGKTLLARAVAGESGATFFSLTASEFVEMFVGVGAARVRDLFAQAKKQAPSIIFIDELDAIGRPRGAGGSGNDERDQTLNQLLVELDGFGSDAGVVVIAATNRVDVLDKALVRAGRFDRKVTVQPPTREGRLQILKVHVRDKPLNADVDLADLAAEMNGFTGAIIANVVNSACLAAAREGRDDVCAANFDAAVEAETLGKALPIDRGEANDRRLARVHAACAVATAILMRDVCRLNFVSIVPRETNLDGCVSLKDFPEVERPNAMTRSILTRHTRVCFVPQLAEEEHYGFDDLSFAAAPYTARAREVATMMVSAAGMGAGADARSNYVPATDQFMIADFLRSDVVEMLLRSTTAEAYFETDREARVMLQRQHAEARAFVKRQRAAIDALTEALYEKKSVDDEAIDAIVKRHAVPEPGRDEDGAFLSPEDRDRLEPWAGEMPEGSVPATNEWIET